MFQPDSNCGEKDEESYARLPQDWIAVFHYPERGTLDDGCPSVIDRVSVLQSPLIFTHMTQPRQAKCYNLKFFRVRIDI